MAALTERVEDGLYSAIRGMDETIMLLNHMGDHFAEGNQPKLAALYFKKAKEADDRSQMVRKAAFSHEQLNNDALINEAGDKNWSKNPKIRNVALWLLNQYFSNFPHG